MPGGEYATGNIRSITNPIVMNTGKVIRVRASEKLQPRNAISNVSIGIFIAEKAPR